MFQSPSTAIHDMSQQDLLPGETGLKQGWCSNLKLADNTVIKETIQDINTADRKSVQERQEEEDKKNAVQLVFDEASLEDVADEEGIHVEDIHI